MSRNSVLTLFVFASLGMFSSLDKVGASQNTRRLDVIFGVGQAVQSEFQHFALLTIRRDEGGGVITCHAIAIRAKPACIQTLTRLTPLKYLNKQFSPNKHSRRQS